MKALAFKEVKEPCKPWDYNFVNALDNFLDSSILASTRMVTVIILLLLTSYTIAIVARVFSWLFSFLGIYFISNLMSFKHSCIDISMHLLICYPWLQKCLDTS